MVPVLLRRAGPGPLRCDAVRGLEGGGADTPGLCSGCSSLLRSRTAVVDLLFLKMLPSAPLPEEVVVVSLFRPGYQVLDVPACGAAALLPFPADADPLRVADGSRLSEADRMRRERSERP
jgi:hypothetical protein